MLLYVRGTCAFARQTKPSSNACHITLDIRFQIDAGIIPPSLDRRPAAGDYPGRLPHVWNAIKLRLARTPTAAQGIRSESEALAVPIKKVQQSSANQEISVHRRPISSMHAAQFPRRQQTRIHA